MLISSISGDRISRMIKIELNMLSIAGLLFGLSAMALLLVEVKFEESFTVARIFGPGAPFAKSHIWMILAIVGATVYLAGRIVWLFKEHIGMSRPK